MAKICLDAGHGINTAGKRTPVFTKGDYKGKQIREAEQNYPVMEFVGEYLKYNGFDVCYTNTDIKREFKIHNYKNYAEFSYVNFPLILDIDIMTYNVNLLYPHL